ncbi:MAG: glyoxalase [Actinobacteria bacterium RBG_19FT_COMBO_54_7]|uniref:Glyoxalase n=1 Tax=Candidatus Solincola sediminis TaxID=1797199 RepID=A0A1F2WN11_9ACTN|nr:MAG: glyoxalase [Candidatus Solincola sediminis]OFW58224.1 MAG: glyoxalase [Candidatus Solincola sediminis]OFW65225.1 MAG: glyoxalase [Actinobacteria bacterium RBG_19FT_COMBO_54_7]
MANENAVGWFEIPVTDMERAMRFYQDVFEVALERNQMGPLDMAWFPWVEGGTGSGGSLVKNEMYKPSMDGVLIYFTAHSGDLADELARVEGAGGKVLMQKMLISDDIGFMGLCLDTEGNRFAIHSRQ